jgi:hypothetical protein
MYQHNCPCVRRQLRNYAQLNTQFAISSCRCLLLYYFKVGLGSKNLWHPPGCPKRTLLERRISNSFEKVTPWRDISYKSFGKYRSSEDPQIFQRVCNFRRHSPRRHIFSHFTVYVSENDGWPDREFKFVVYEIMKIPDYKECPDISTRPSGNQFYSPDRTPSRFLRLSTPLTTLLPLVKSNWRKSISRVNCTRSPKMSDLKLTWIVLKILPLV